MTHIDRQQLTTLIARGTPVVLLEALPERYFAAGHLPGARHFPHDRAAELAASVVPEREATIVVYCASETCRNSHVAAAALTQLGYPDVRVYAGGKKDWQEAGLVLER
ncbi:rhodanese-like domain-containing protein [Sandaracinus amylolyticus]|uniref:Rhodanese domain-containing protein n=1 Tax=Sandaracinus amylolyticus TaxID=927083 RepID=A0A0F6YMD1_9BACT|nr:rhodanese-like domain-containing protein [Sandaracinus amylolyticus]AKF10135.1 hypothetical protein DB32_007284 [Sandaracinus amylolyticus]